MKSISGCGVMFPTLLVCLALFLFTGCQARTVAPERPSEPVAVNKVTVLPVANMREVYGEGVNFRCPLCGRSALIGEVEADAAEFLTARVAEQLGTRENLEVVPPGQAAGVQSRVLAQAVGKMSDIEMIQQIGRRTGADAVLVGRVYRFVQREGTRYAVKTPASVSFDFLLVGTQDGALIWDGYFLETQRSLSENLFNIGTFLKRKMRWLTAEELAVDGLTSVFQTFPGQ